jgi:uncharacterized membrane protein
MAEKFTIDEAVQFGWNKFLEKVGPLLLVVSLPVIFIPLVISAPEYIMAFMGDKIDNNIQMVWNLIMMPVKIFVNIFLHMGMIRISLKAVDGQDFGFNDYMEALPNFWSFLAAGFLYFVLTMLGMIALFVGALVVFVLFHWYSYLIIDKRFGPLQALGGSLALCKGAYADLAILWLVIFAISIVGFIALIIGIIPAQLLTLMILARVYRRLVENTPEISAA